MRGFLIQNGDFTLNASGFFETVSSVDKVKRDIYKRLMTDKNWGSNGTSYYRYNPDYGITLNNTALYANQSPSNLLTLINNAVGAAFNDMVASQKADSQLPANEVIDTVDYYSYFDTTNNNVVKCTISVKLVSGVSINLGTFSQPILSVNKYQLPGVSFQSLE